MTLTNQTTSIETNAAFRYIQEAADKTALRYMDDHDSQEKELHGFIVLNNEHVCPVLPSAKGYSLNPLHIDGATGALYLSRRSVGGSILNVDFPTAEAAVVAYQEQAEQNKFMKKINQFEIFADSTTEKVESKTQTQLVIEQLQEGTRLFIDDHTGEEATVEGYALLETDQVCPLIKNMSFSLNPFYVTEEGQLRLSRASTGNLVRNPSRLPMNKVIEEYKTQCDENEFMDKIVSYEVF